jgi:hypothetical protein
MNPEQIFRIIASEFEDVDPSGAIAVADMQVATSIRANKRALLVAYLAAHILTVSGRKLGASGDVASITESELSITYTNSGGSKSELASSSYGKEYLRLVRSFISIPRTRVSGDYVGYC